MKIAVVTCEGFNELDSFVVSALLNRAPEADWKAEIVCPAERVTSMNGVVIDAQQPLSYANEADIVLFGSGIHTRDIVEDDAIMSQFELDPERQLIGSQCSGALFLHRLGLVDGQAVCSDTMTRPHLEARGVTVMDKPFHASGNVASAGGCLSSQYLAMWVLWRKLDREQAGSIIHYVAPVGEKDDYLARATSVVGAYM